MRLSALQRWSAGGRDFALTMPLCQRMIQAEMNGSEVETDERPLSAQMNDNCHIYLSYGRMRGRSIDTESSAKAHQTFDRRICGRWRRLHRFRKAMPAIRVCTSPDRSRRSMRWGWEVDERYYCAGDFYPCPPSVSSRPWTLLLGRASRSPTCAGTLALLPFSYYHRYKPPSVVEVRLRFLALELLLRVNLPSSCRVFQFTRNSPHVRRGQKMRSRKCTCWGRVITQRATTRPRVVMDVSATEPQASVPPPNTDFLLPLV